MINGFDLTDNQLYTITDQTKEFVKGLDSDVDVYLVVCAIAKAEKIDPDALYDEKVAQYAKQSGYSDVATLEKDYSQKYLRQVIINEEVLNVLEENAVAVAPPETESEASK